MTVDGIRKLLKSCEALEYIDVTEVRWYEAGLQFPVGCKVNFCGIFTKCPATSLILIRVAEYWKQVY